MERCEWLHQEVTSLQLHVLLRELRLSANDRVGKNTVPEKCSTLELYLAVCGFINLFVIYVFIVAPSSQYACLHQAPPLTALIVHPS